ncbi:hypothetical protein AAC387_Pa06g0491 [Persea americana]
MFAGKDRHNVAFPYWKRRKRRCNGSGGEGTQSQEPNMAISLVRKTAVAANRIPKETGLIHLLLRRTLPNPPAILLLMLLLVWNPTSLRRLHIP